MESCFKSKYYPYNDILFSIYIGILCLSWSWIPSHLSFERYESLYHSPQRIFSLWRYGRSKESTVSRFHLQNIPKTRSLHHHYVRCESTEQKKDYWAFYVNTIYSQVGVSNYVVGQHDNLLMVYETSTH